MGVKIDTAIVLCAGLGRRMRPLTEERPKPLVTFLGRALIDHILDRLVGAGITRVVINVHYLADMMVEHVLRRCDLDVVISDEHDELLDTGGGIVKALPHLGPRPFLIHNADSVWFTEDADHPDPLARLADAWDETVDTLLLTCPHEQAFGFGGAGDFYSDETGLLSRRGERASAPLIFAGVSVAHPRMFDGCRAEPFSLNRLWDRAMNAGRLKGLGHTGPWFHIGDPEALSLAERECAGMTEGGAWTGPRVWTRKTP